MNLYEIDKDLRTLWTKIAEQDGEITEEDMQVLNDLNIARDDKLKGYGILIRELKGDIADCSEEIKRIKEIQDKKKKLVERLENTLKTFMENNDIPKFNSIEVNIGFRKSQVLEIEDNAELPNEYMRIKEVREPDKEAIKDAIKHGVEFKGIYLIDKQNIQIK
ncbi:MAG: siphovirus Gp157 family protein [Firmicutes bacterium]|nr:siphovirus Gp157 family protein [Candidatus Caballimonas caccae]